MKILIIGANGKEGKLLVKEALKRGHTVEALVRDASKLEADISKSIKKIIEKEVFNITYDDVKENDVIISALGFWSEDTLDNHKKAAVHLSEILKGRPNRLLIVGGAGVLIVNKEKNIRLMDSKEFPDIFKPVAKASSEAFNFIIKQDNINWTYLIPAADFQYEGLKTGEYKLGGEEMILNQKGESVISYSDYAIAMIDEAEKGNYIKKCFSVVSK